jgi:PUA domain protein
MKKAMNNKEAKEFIDSVKSFDIDKKSRLEKDEDIIIIDGIPSFFFLDGKLIPTLKMLMVKNNLKKITVDMGAIPFVIKGADIMRPGIKIIEENICKEDYVLVVDEKFSKPLSVGKALFPTEEMRELKNGKVIKNIHYVGDRIWNYN